MAVIEELIRIEENGAMSFGNYELLKKTKVDNFEVAGNLFKVKTFKEITKLEKNGIMVMEVVPGATVHNFVAEANGVSFSLEGLDNVQVTVEIEPNTEYKIIIDDMTVGKETTNMAGKITFGADLKNNTPKIQIEKA